MEAAECSRRLLPIVGVSFDLNGGDCDIAARVRYMVGWCRVGCVDADRNDGWTSGGMIDNYVSRASAFRSNNAVIDASMRSKEDNPFPN